MKSKKSFPKSKFMQYAKKTLNNKVWLDYSAKIALIILRHIRQNNISQKELANKLNVSPQRINVILKGQVNLTLETITKLEYILDVKLINILIPEQFDSQSSNSDYHEYISPQSIQKDFILPIDQFDPIHSFQNKCA